MISYTHAMTTHWTTFQFARTTGFIFPLTLRSEWFALAYNWVPNQIGAQIWAQKCIQKKKNFGKNRPTFMAFFPLFLSVLLHIPLVVVFSRDYTSEKTPFELNWNARRTNEHRTANILCPKKFVLRSISGKQVENYRGTIVDCVYSSIQRHLHFKYTHI